MKRFKKTVILFLSMLMLFSVTPITEYAFPSNQSVIVAEAAVKLNYKKLSMAQYRTKKLKLTGTKKKIKWSSSNPKVATVSSKGKVNSLKPGNAVITAKAGKKKYKCSVTVVKRYNEGGMWKCSINGSTWYFDVNVYTSEVTNNKLGWAYVYKDNAASKEIADGEYVELSPNHYRVKYSGGVLEFTVKGKKLTLTQVEGDFDGESISGTYTLLNRHDS